jgi:homoserine O-succinyltransferase
MPDAALKVTEQQFLSLLESASDGLLIRPVFYSLKGISRSETAKRRIDKMYLSTDRLGESPLDGLIVTGKEPITSDLRDEPCWNSFKRLVDWARDNTRSTIWSCLAAHAAVLHDDGIQRVRANGKQFGVFECERLVDHALLAGAPASMKCPHSRWNGLSEMELNSRGYSILSKSFDVGVDLFTKHQDSLFVYFQGHPEYTDRTLLLEYRRDAGRYLKGEIGTYPNLPQNYFNVETTLALTEVEQQAQRSRQSGLMLAVAEVLDASAITNTWNSDAVRIYQNWLQYIAAHKELADPQRTNTVSTIVTESVSHGLATV